MKRCLIGLPSGWKRRSRKYSLFYEARVYGSKRSMVHAGKKLLGPIRNDAWWKGTVAITLHNTEVEEVKGLKLLGHILFVKGMSVMTVVHEMCHVLQKWSEKFEDYDDEHTAYLLEELVLQFYSQVGERLKWKETQ